MSRTRRAEMRKRYPMASRMIPRVWWRWRLSIPWSHEATSELLWRKALGRVQG